MLRVLNNVYDHPLPLEENASMQFAGGLLRHGYQCGQIWGAALAAGARAYRLFGSGPRTEALAVLSAQRLVASFRRRNKDIDCLELTDVTQRNTTSQMLKYFVTGGPLRCFRMAASYAPRARTEINASLDADMQETSASPVSCSAVLAGKMGASGLHTAMVSGLAGGIGLCGGACGALGAAIWIRSMQEREDHDKPIGFENPRAATILERFLKHTDYEFGCTEITGRTFEHVGDHAGYVRAGGCAELIDVLVSA